MKDSHKKCLVVSSYDLRRNTSSNIRTVALIQALAKSGCTVHCFFVSANKDKDDSIYVALNDCCERIVLYRETPLSESGRLDGEPKTHIIQGFVGRIRTYIIKMFSKISVYDVYRTQFFFLKKQDLGRLDKDYDMIISSSEPRSSHLLARKIRKLCGMSTPWVQYWGDPMTNDVASEKLLRGRECREEHRLLKQAHMAVYTNPIVVDYMQKKYVDCKEKICWIPTTDIDSVTKERCSLQKKYDVCYLGDYLTKYRNILPLYQVCKKNKLKAAIIGNSDLALESTEYMKVTPRVLRKEAKQIEDESKIIVILENKGLQTASIQVPGKLYHYALTDKEILVITESAELRKRYSEYRRFVFAENTEQDILQAISQILSNEAKEVRSEPLAEFSQENVVKRFLNLFEKII